MPVRGLEQDLKERDLIIHSPIIALKNQGIAIDGAWFLRKYTPRQNPVHTLVTGKNVGAVAVIRDAVAALKRLGCRVTWVWNGLPVRRMGGGDDLVPLHLERVRRGWAEYSKGEKIAAHKLWSSAINYEENVNYISKVLEKMNVEVIRAPYYAMAQGAYMLESKFCNWFFGPTDFLLFEHGRKMIVDFVFADKIGSRDLVGVGLIDRRVVLKALDLHLSRFQNTMLLMGCEFCSTLPPFSLGFEFKMVYGAVKDVPSVVNAIELSIEHGVTRGPGAVGDGLKGEGLFIRGPETTKEYLNMFLRARAIIDYHPVLNENGELVVQREPPTPDLSSIFGRRLRDEMYAKFSQGQYTVQYMKGLTFGRITEICGKKLLKRLGPALDVLYGGKGPLEVMGIGIAGSHSKWAGGGQGSEALPDGPIEAMLRRSVGNPVSFVSGLDRALQCTILCLAGDGRGPSKSSSAEISRMEKLVENVFLYNQVEELAMREDEIDGAILELAEGFRFAAGVFRDILWIYDSPSAQAKHFDSVDVANGLRMKRLLREYRASGKVEATAENERALKKNYLFGKSLGRLLVDNGLASSSDEIDGLVKYMDNVLSI